MYQFDSIVFDDGVEAEKYIRLVAGWASEKILPAELVITDWDMDGIDFTDKTQDVSYYIRTWNWMVKGKKRITTTVTWTLFQMNEDNSHVLLDEGDVYIRNGEIYAGSHLA